MTVSGRLRMTGHSLAQKPEVANVVRFYRRLPRVSPSKGRHYGVMAQGDRGARGPNGSRNATAGSRFSERMSPCVNPGFVRRARGHFCRAAAFRLQRGLLRLRTKCYSPFRAVAIAIFEALATCTRPRVTANSILQRSPVWGLEGPYPSWLRLIDRLLHAV